MVKAPKRKSKHLLLNQIEVNCITCENRFRIYTTLQKDFKVDVCSHCHPFYIGTQKFESKAGRIERFRRLQRKRTVILDKATNPDDSSQTEQEEKNNVQ